MLESILLQATHTRSKPVPLLIACGGEKRREKDFGTVLLLQFFFTVKI
jgi:hypothetical protein